jgi:outer membrane protein
MKRLALKSFAAVLLAGTAVSGAMASDLPSRKGPVMAPPVETWSPWMIRARALAVVPQEKATIYTPAGVVIPGAGLSITNSIVPEVDLTYFFTQNIAVEVIAGVTPHKIKGAGILAGIPVGSAWLLPPTISLQYHFTGMGAFKPYVGIGANYTVFFNEKASAASGFGRLDLKDNFGFALQAGVDIMLNRNWGINLDVKKLFLSTDATVYTLGGAPAVTAKVKIDPWIFGAGVTYRF